MTPEQIQSIIRDGRFPGKSHPTDFIETHISWVLITPDFVFKIKKPVQFSFLDFSTLEKRAFYCQEEVHLNRRLASEMYLGVLPVALADDGLPTIGETQHVPVDFAVWMKRMDNTRQMDKLLLQHAVTPKMIKDLAVLLAGFHQTVVIPGPETRYNAGDNRADFDDLFGLEDVAVAIFGPEAANQMENWRKKVGLFLDKHEHRLHERAQSGYWVEGHGDLHSRNIFLLPDGPVVFDCLEFNPHFRRVDVLNELAFLCMDLDAGGHHELENLFMKTYLSVWNCCHQTEDGLLLQYFKAYRANIRLKVTLLAWQQQASADLEKTATVYWNLLEKYLNNGAFQPPG